MRAKLNQKYLLITFQDQQLDKWSRFDQGNRSAAQYIESFDEFLTRCSRFADESSTVTLSRFKSGLCENLCRELFARDVCDLEHAYQIVRDLNVSRESYFLDDLDYKSQSTKFNLEQSQYKNSFSRPIQKEDDKGRGQVESVPRINPRTQCYKCQAMVMWRRFVPVNPKPSIWVSNKIRKGKIHRRKL